MVAVKVDRKTGKCEIIDDVEGTPGSSRQITIKSEQKDVMPLGWLMNVR